MAKLIFSLDGAVLAEYPIDKERISIGRRAGNDIHIDNLAVSGKHASILTIGQDSFLEDLGSTNGTLVNGKAIRKHVLEHGDVIHFGKFELQYVQDESAISHAGGFAKTLLLRPEGQPAGKPLKPLPASARSAAGAEQAAASIQVLTGKGAGKLLVLNKALTTLGKPGVQVAVITRRPQGYFITHVEGGDFPLVNGKSAGALAQQLRHQDLIELAGVTMQFSQETT